MQFSYFYEYFWQLLQGEKIFRSFYQLLHKKITKNRLRIEANAHTFWDFSSMKILNFRVFYKVNIIPLTSWMFLTKKIKIWIWTFITTYYEENQESLVCFVHRYGGWVGIIKKILHTDRAVLFNPLPHGGRTYLPISSWHANSYKSSEGMVSSKIRYSSSWILGLFQKLNNAYLRLYLSVFNLL
jgi:hypothetical protein